MGVLQKVFLFIVLGAVLTAVIYSGNNFNSLTDAEGINASSKNVEFSVDSSEIFKSIDWIVDSLKLKKQGYDKFWIYEFKVSPNGKYVLVNISEESENPIPGPFYRYLIYQKGKRRICFPSKKTLTKINLGYPYIKARFTDNSEKCLIIAGYRTLVAQIVQLPEGKLLKQMDLEIEADFDTFIDSLIKEQ